EPHGEAERFTDLHDVHGRAHGTSHRGFGDAVVLEDRDLALGRATAVAAHSWEDERPGAEVLEGPHGGADDNVDVGDAPAASTARDGITALDRQAGGGQGVRHRPWDVRNALPSEGLAQAHHSGERHAGILPGKCGIYGEFRCLPLSDESLSCSRSWP